MKRGGLKLEKMLRLRRQSGGGHQHDRYAPVARLPESVARTDLCAYNQLAKLKQTGCLLDCYTFRKTCPQKPFIRLWTTRLNAPQVPDAEHLTLCVLRAGRTLAKQRPREKSRDIQRPQDDRHQPRH
jgi:hypothetical protein